MQLCDDGSKVDLCDYQLKEEAYDKIQEMLEVHHTIDCFATKQNRLCRRFIAKYHCVDAEGEGFFAQEISDEICWVHPPRTLIARTLQRLWKQRAQGTIVVPHDTSEVWWPLVMPGAPGTVPASGKGPCDTGDMRLRMPRWRGLLRKRDKLMPPGYRDLMAIRFDYSKRA